VAGWVTGERERLSERDDRRVAVCTLDQVNRSAVNDSTTITDARAELLVDERGVVHRAFVEIEGEREGDRRRLFVEFRTLETGSVDVQPPD
jgi:hypothetical protein